MGLSGIPRFKERRIALVNMAHGGWKQPQQLLALSWMLALGGELNVLINVDGFNEVALDGAENAKRGVFPAYPRGWAVRVDDFLDSDQTPLLAAVALGAERRIAMASVFDYRILRWSPTANLVWGLVDRRLNHDFVSARLEFAQSQSQQNRFRQIGPSVDADAAERLRILVTVWRNASGALARQSAASDIHYFQFLQPNQYDEDAKPMGTAERSVAFRSDHPYRLGARIGYPLLREAGETLRQEGDFFFDFSRLFEDVREPLFADNCCHLTADGYARFVDAVVESIAASPDRPAPTR